MVYSALLGEQTGRMLVLVPLPMTARTRSEAREKRERRRKPEANKKGKSRTKARVVVASLNIKGAGSRRAGVPEKWLKVNQLIRDRKIAVLAIQEAHLTKEDTEVINEMFRATMWVTASPDPINGTGARGVAIAFNKRMVNTDAIKQWELIEGRAMMVEINWTKNEKLRVLNVYAPNESVENAVFWKTVQGKLGCNGVPRPMIVLGDFNVVTDPRDRYPPRQDPREPVEALVSMMTSGGLVDGLRQDEPERRCFSYLQSTTGSQSRLDRIYVKRSLAECADEWVIEAPGIPTDHSLVSVSVANYDVPYLGKGRWSIPHALLSDPAFEKTMTELGVEAWREMRRLEEQNRTGRLNPQLVHQRFKAKLVGAARERAKVKIPKIRKQIEAMKTDLKLVVNNGDSPSEGEVRHAAILQDKIAELELKSFGAKRAAVAGMDWVKGETVCKYWTRMNVTPLPKLRKERVTNREQSQDMRDGLMRWWRSRRDIMTHSKKTKNLMQCRRGTRSG
ncbi:Endonuclease/exonuclease/phosphatase [Cerioporus squamosus]|nr:Endonuclease/exonuclease/phosphatase [Cerioporus squamosus]